MTPESDKGDSAEGLVEIDRVKGPVSLGELIKITEPMPKGTIMMQEGEFIVFKINADFAGPRNEVRQEDSL